MYPDEEYDPEEYDPAAHAVQIDVPLCPKKPLAQLCEQLNEFIEEY
jgi:hypothetical protein